ncbi:hypothetical protein Q5752_003989 [Cryptotrichosporon argae]
MSADTSSPSDFAFEPPADKYYQQPYGSFATSSFSSYSAEHPALPAISRDFTKPSPEMRRPATAGGALQRPFAKPDVPPFHDPFATDASRAVPSQEAVDPHYVDDAWMSSLPSAPATVPNFSFAPAPYVSRASVPPATRPQTSDGLPSFSSQLAGAVPLPSARTLGGYYHAPLEAYRADEKRDMRSASMSEMPNFGLAVGVGVGVGVAGPGPGPRGYSLDSAVGVARDMTFMTVTGPQHKKRPRRRYDEIERLYLCGFNGCEKSYGTLNHLNAHVAMQKHGEKRLPSEFKEMRKAWRKKKREQQTQASSSAQGWNRASMSSVSGSEYDRRASLMSEYDPDYSTRSSYVSYGYDARPTTASSVTSSVDGRFAYAYPADASGVRRPSVPLLPTQYAAEFAPPPSEPRPSYPFTSAPVVPSLPPVSFAGQFAFQR